MDIKEALAYIDGGAWFGAEPTLERERELLSRLGDPQNELKFVHIAGTNGKGSCAAMTAAVLKACGYRTGLFTSPYLFRFNERIQINGKQIEDDELAEIVGELKPAAESMEEHPTVFEMITAAALLYFCRQKCDIVVLEVGLGGRFDATNVIDAPECAVIMNIGLDHTAILGDTVEKIAAEKAGIIKPGCTCVAYQMDKSIEQVISDHCEDVGARLRVADFSSIVPEFDSLEGQVFTYMGDACAIPLLGENQRKNAAVVLEVVDVLRSEGWKLEQSDVEHGLYSVSWPARFEVVKEDPYFVVDGGHNPQCAQTVRDNLLRYFGDRRRVLLVGMLKDKDYASVAEILAPAADEIVTVTPESPRALAAEELAACFEKLGKPVTPCDSIKSGVITASDLAGDDGMVCCVGSLYLAGAVRDCFGLH